jgi:hypothetical protein
MIALPTTITPMETNPASSNWIHSGMGEAFRPGHATAAAGHSSAWRSLSNGLSKGPKVSVTGEPSKKRPRFSASGTYQDDLANDPCFVSRRSVLNRNEGLLNLLNEQGNAALSARLNPANADTIRHRRRHVHGPSIGANACPVFGGTEAGRIPIGEHGSSFECSHKWVNFWA